MLVALGFPAEEVRLLAEAAKRLDVIHRCKFICSIEEFYSQQKAAKLTCEGRLFPSIVFLNLDQETDKWREALVSLKNHHKMRCLPVVCLGRLSGDQMAEAYQLGARSVICKPDDFGSMMRTASCLLNYWLNVVVLPSKYLDAA